METMEQKTQLVNVVLFTDQIRWMNNRNLNLSSFVQDSLDEWMYEDPDKGVRKEIEKRREEKLKSFMEKDIKKMSRKILIWIFIFLLSSLFGIVFSVLSLREQIFHPFSVLSGSYFTLTLILLGTAVFSRMRMGI